VDAFHQFSHPAYKEPVMSLLIPQSEITSHNPAVSSAVVEHSEEVSTHAILANARRAAEASGVPYAGGVNPVEAHELFVEGAVVLVDVRTAEEWKFVGHVPGSVHVAWQIGAALTKNPRFVRELEGKVAKDAVVLFLCRSGKRSAAAAEAAAKAGFTNSFNVLEGFEGDLDNAQQRGGNGGWRHYGLPWVQD
jgi:rhodanese-related sulfurtransferase